MYELTQKAYTFIETEKILRFGKKRENYISGRG